MVQTDLQKLRKKIKEASNRDLFLLDEKSGKLIQDMNLQYQSYKKGNKAKRKQAKHHYATL